MRAPTEQRKQQQVGGNERADRWFIPTGKKHQSATTIKPLRAEVSIDHLASLYLLLEKPGSFLTHNIQSKIVADKVMVTALPVGTGPPSRTITHYHTTKPVSSAVINVSRC